MEYKKLEMMDGWNIFGEAYKDTEKARLDFFLAGLIVFAICMLIFYLPFIGGILSGFAQPLVFYGFYRMAKNLKEKKESRISTVFEAVQDKEVFEKLKSLCIVTALIGAITLIGNLFPKGIGGNLISFILMMFVHSAISAIAIIAPILMMEQKMDKNEAIRTSIRLSIDNIAAYVLMSFVFTIFSLGSIATFGVGFYFLIPITMYFPYLIYQKLYPGNVKIIT